VAVHRVVQGERTLHVRPPGRKIAAIQAQEPVGAVTDCSRDDVTIGLAELPHLGGELLRAVEIGQKLKVQKLAQQDGQEIAWAIELTPELPRPDIGLPHLRGAKAARGDQCPAERDLQIEFLLLPPNAVRQTGYQDQPPAEQRLGFNHRRAR